jgi:putative transcription factor
MSFDVTHDTKDIYLNAKPKNDVKHVYHPKTHLQKVEEIDNTDHSLTHKQLNHNVSLKIQQARQAKHMTQKELAIKINEKVNVIQDYENGKAIPTRTILNKISRVLNVKL